MAKNCQQCSQRPGRRYYVLDDNNEIFTFNLCDKCYPAETYDAKPRARDLLVDQITNAMQ